MPDRTLVLWNAAARNAVPAEEVERLLGARPETELVRTRSADDLRERARAAAAEELLLVAAGGDGTVSTVVDGMLGAAEQRVVLAVLPLGTANDFARTLGLPDAIEDVIAGWDRPRIRRLDAVRATTADGTRHMVNVASCGNAGRIDELLTDELKRRWGPFCYLRSGLEVATDLDVYRVTVTIDDRAPETFDALNVVVANARYAGGGLAVAPDADPSDGLLDVVVARDGPTLGLIGVAADLVLGNYLEHDLVAFRRGAVVTIESEPPMPFQLDGEPGTPGPMRFELLPRALRIAT